MKEFKVLITSPSDREKIVAEIWFGNNLIAEINQEGDELEIDIYPNQRLTFKLDDLLSNIEKAKKKLMG